MTKDFGSPSAQSEHDASTEWPTTCSAVTYDLADEHKGERWYEKTSIGDLLWNPKGGYGHVLARLEPCGGKYDCGCGGWLGVCEQSTWVCECGEDNSWRDHHYKLLARRGS